MVDKITKAAAGPAGSSILEYEYHPGNGWGYEVKKYRLDFSDPERPSFSVVDSWIHQR